MGATDGKAIYSQRHHDAQPLRAGKDLSIPLALGSRAPASLLRTRSRIVLTLVGAYSPIYWSSFGP